MASHPSSNPPQPDGVPPVVVPQHFVPPTAREMRGQSVQRLQVGLFGLAAMLLLVGLANIIMDRARLADDSAGDQAGVSASDSPAPKTDPLADIGMVPSPDGDASNSPGPGTRNAPR